MTEERMELLLGGKDQLTESEQNDFNQFIKNHTVSDDMIPWFKSIQKPENLDDETF